MFDAVTYAAAVNKAKATILPAGGGEGQVLGKDADGNTTWVDNAIAENAIVTSETQPESPATKIWIDEGAEEIELLTREDLEGFSGGVGSAVSYEEQELTEEQQTQARKNIGSYYKTESVDTVFERTWLGNSDLWEEDEWNEGIYRLPEFFDGTENPVKNNNENIFVINGEEFVTRNNYYMIERDDYYFSISFADFPYVYVVTNTKQDYNVSVKTRIISVNGVGSEYTGVCIQNISFGNTYTDEIHYPGYTLIPVQFSKDLAEIDEAKNIYKLNINVNTEGSVQYYDDTGKWHSLRLFDGKLTQCYYNPNGQDGYYYAQYEFLAVDNLTGESLFVYVKQRDNNHLDENFMVLFDGYNGALHYTNEHLTVIYLENGAFAEDFNANITLGSVLLNGFYSGNPGVQNNTYVLNEVTETDTNGGSNVNLDKYFPCGCERKKIQKYNNYGNYYYVDEFWFNYTKEKVDEDGNIVKSIISFVYSQIDNTWKIYNEQSVTIASYYNVTEDLFRYGVLASPGDWVKCPSDWWGDNNVYYAVFENIDFQIIPGDEYELYNTGRPLTYTARWSDKDRYTEGYDDNNDIAIIGHDRWDSLSENQWENITIACNVFGLRGMCVFWWGDEPWYFDPEYLIHKKSKPIPYEAMPKAVKDFGEKIEELENSIGSVDSALQAMIDKAEGAL